MTLQDLVSHFGSQSKAAKALGVSAVSVCLWRNGIPKKRQQQIEAMTGGILRAA